LINMQKSLEPPYLTASEAAAELSVSLATLYAYVSRGLVRSEPTPDGRGKRYRADDVRALRARRAPPREEGARANENNPWGTPILDSAITLIAADGLFYRGASAVALSQSATLEHVACLLWDVADNDPFTDEFAVDENLERAIAALANARPVDRAAAIMGLGAAFDPMAFNRSRVGRTATGARIVRLMAALISGSAVSSDPVHQIVARAWRPGDRRAEDLIRRALVLLADHEFNSSAFAARVVASTGATLYDAVAAGIAALKGPRHGGASVGAAKLLRSIGGNDIASEVRQRAAIGEYFPGFGHLVYKGGDPRAIALLHALGEAGADPRLVKDLPAAVLEASGQHANIDYALAVMGVMLDLPADSGMSIFAIARTAGWIAHAIEQSESRGFIRPRARYTGPAPRE
jgi:citrate synthase